MAALGLRTKRSGRGMNYIKIIIKHEVFSWDDKLEPIRRDPINSFQEKAIKDFKQAAEQRKTLRLPERDIQKRDDEIKKARQECWKAYRNNQLYWQLVPNMAPMQMSVPYSMQPQNIPLPQKVVQPAKEATPPVEDYSYDYYAKDADGKVIWVNDSNNGNGVTPFDCKKGKYAPTTGSGIDPFGNKT
jgi:hypothetical protein